MHWDMHAHTPTSTTEFNIRHLSNVFQGLLMAQPAEFNNPGKFAMLWLHESERVYGDRLVSYDGECVVFVQTLKRCKGQICCARS